MKKFWDAFNGFRLSAQDHSMKLQYGFALLAIVAGVLLRLSPGEWSIWVLAMALVLLSEGFNSCIERLADCLHKEKDKKIGEVKDYAAGMVLLSAFISMLLALSVLWHHFGG